MKNLLFLLLISAATVFGQGVGQLPFYSAPVLVSPQAATPTFNNDTGTYSGSVTVTISDTTPSPTITYCTNVGSDCTPGTTYSTAITITTTATHLCAFATATGYTQSSTHCGTYTITPFVTLVQSNFAYFTTGATTCGSYKCQSIVLTGVTGGDSIAFSLTTYSTVTIESITDNHSGTLTQVGSTAAQSTNRYTSWFCENTTSGINGSYTFTATLSASVIQSLQVYETSNSSCANASVLQTTTSSSANPVTINTNGTLASPGLLLSSFAITGATSVAVTGGSPFTLITGQTQATAGVGAYYLSSATTAVTSSITLNTGSSYAAEMFEIH